MASVSVPLAPAPGAVPLAATSAAAPLRTACASCGGRLLGDFCHGCGQRVQAGRLTVRGIAAHLVTDAFDLNRGLLFTAVALFRRPGEAVREYVSGATVRYTNPVKYLLLLAALALLMMVRLDVFETQMRALPGVAAAQESVQAQQMQAELSAWISRHMNLLMIAGVPVIAWLSRRFFRAAGFNYAEHLVFNVFAYAQMCLLSLLVLPLTQAAGLGARGMMAASLVNVGYYVWALASFTRARPLRGILGGVAVQALGMLGMALLGGVAGAVYAVVALSMR
ncbi:MAG TPA: DUF3667 domain-containing protein [Longimicrobiaceae bacterium]|jgi:hypothetical protein